MVVLLLSWLFCCRIAVSIVITSVAVVTASINAVVLQKLESYEESRIEKLQKECSVPARYRKSFYKAEERKERAKEIQRMKAEKQRKAQEVQFNIQT